MTNPERQRALDKKKWAASIEHDCDMSGKMDYCDHCEHQAYDNDFSCEVSQEERETKCPCATAYNRMRR